MVDDTNEALHGGVQHMLVAFVFPLLQTTLKVCGDVGHMLVSQLAVLAVKAGFQVDYSLVPPPLR